MNKRILTMLISAQSLVVLGQTLSNDLYYNVQIDADIKLEEIIDGEIITKKLASPRTTTLAVGDDAKLTVSSKFKTEVPEYSDITTRTGDAGVIFTVAASTSNSFIFINGTVQVCKSPSVTSLDENGEVAVQKIHNIQFSLKLENDTALKMEPVEMPDGSKILLTFKTKTIGEGESREERRKTLESLGDAPQPKYFF